MEVGLGATVGVIATAGALSLLLLGWAVVDYLWVGR